MYDLCVIGGGACGMAAAIASGKRGKRVIIIEKNAKLGKKLYASGNGRCNITNKGLYGFANSLEYERYISEVYHSSYDDYVGFLAAAIGNAPYKDVIGFLDEIGVYTREINGYVYPASMQASAFVWALIDALKKYGVEVVLKTEVRHIETCDGQYEVDVNDGVIRAKNVLIACGGKSCSSLGGSSGGYILAGDFSHEVVSVRQTLCGMVTKEQLTDAAGVRVYARAGIALSESEASDDIQKCEEGEIQITDYGLSGIMIFNLSSLCGRLLDEGRKPFLILDFVPFYDEDMLVREIMKNGNRTILGGLNSYVNDKLAAYLIKRADLKPKEEICTMAEDDIKRLIKLAKSCRFHIERLNDFDSAQACAGGVALNLLNHSFMSKLHKGLYFAGEVVDIDGICGGYNITFALLSGIRVGMSI